MRIGGGAVSIADVTDRVARDLGFVRKFWYNEIRNDRAFHRGMSLGGSAGNFSEVQIFNPAASGITLIVKRIIGSGGGAVGFQIRSHNVALATLQGTGFNVDEGATAALGEIRTAQPAAVDGTEIANIRGLGDVLYGIADDWLKELAAGEGLLIVPRGVNAENQTYVEWIEF